MHFQTVCLLLFCIYLCNSVEVPNIKFSNGVEAPVIAFGTWQAEGPAVVEAVKQGFATGFRHIDTAWFFHNEREVGQAIQDSIKDGVLKNREEVFITTKVWPKNMNRKRTLNIINNSLNELNTTYIDLVMIHWPLKNNTEVYSALEDAYEQKLVRAIGVSNFKPKEIEALMKTSKIKPAANYIRIHPGWNQDQTVDYCVKNDIAVAGWSPLGTGSLVKDKILVNIGKKHNKSSAQVMLRWQIDRGFIVIPKSTRKHRIEENFNVFDFKLDENDMKQIHDMPQLNIIDFWG